MKNQRNSLSLLLSVVLLAALTSSCGSSSYHSGCPGKDRPSYRGYGVSAPQMHDFNVNGKQNNKNNSICLEAAQIDA
jgi:hypothetical protein